MSASCILNAPKRLLVLYVIHDLVVYDNATERHYHRSTTIFIVYRVTYFLGDSLDLSVSPKEYEHLRILIVSAVAFSTVIITAYVTLVVNAFIRLGRTDPR
jgi:hypothetical protein